MGSATFEASSAEEQTVVALLRGVRSFRLINHRRDPPRRAPGVLHAAAFVGVILLDRLLHGGRPRRQRPAICSVDVAHIDVHMRRYGRPAGGTVREHHHGVIDPDFGVHQPSIGALKPPELASAEDGDEERDGAPGSIDDQIRRYARVVVRFVHIPVPPRNDRCANQMGFRVYPAMPSGPRHPRPDGVAAAEPAREESMSIDWSGLFIPTVSLPELVLRGSIMYLLIFALMRVLRRDSGTLGTADLILVVLVADAAQNGMASDYKSLTEGAVLVGTVFLWNYALDWLGFRFRWAHKLLNPPPLLLIHDGHILRRNLRKELLTTDDLREQLREHGIDDIASVKRSYLESDGRLSVIRREKSSDDESDTKPRGPH